MISRRPPITYLLLACLLCLVSCATPESMRKDGDLFRSTDSLARIQVRGEIGRICRDTLGYAYPSDEITWQQLPHSRVWSITTKGRHGPITSQFEVQEGKIINSMVLSSKEQRGQLIKSPSYLRQFSGVSLSNSGALSKSVDGITGATISSKAMESAALLVLNLDAIIPERKE